MRSTVGRSKLRGWDYFQRFELCLGSLLSMLLIWTKRILLIHVILKSGVVTSSLGVHLQSSEPLRRNKSSSISLNINGQMSNATTYEYLYTTECDTPAELTHVESASSSAPITLASLFVSCFVMQHQVFERMIF